MYQLHGDSITHRNAVSRTVRDDTAGNTCAVGRGPLLMHIWNAQRPLDNEAIQ